MTSDAFTEQWKLKDGTPVLIRLIRPADEPLMVKFHESLSADSVYFRYLAPTPLSLRVAHRRLAKVCLNDYDHEMALVVEDANPRTGELEIIGVGRLIKFHENNKAEFALVVVDAHQGSGLGSHLLRRLIQMARLEACQSVIGYVLPENRPMLHVCEKLGFRRIHPLGDPVVKVELDLKSTRPGGGEG